MFILMFAELKRLLPLSGVTIKHIGVFTQVLCLLMETYNHLKSKLKRY